MRIYSAVTMGFKSSAIDCSATIVKAENEEDALSDLFSNATKRYPIDAGYTSHRIGVLTDITDGVRQFLREIDAE